MTTLLRHLKFSLALFLVCLAPLAYSQNTDGKAVTLLLEQARSELQGNRNVEALQTAQQAVRQAPQDYRSHYYLGLALLAAQRYAEASQSADQALNLAPESARSNVQALQAEIVKRSQGGELLQQANQAMAEGLNAKAARLYDQAWQANPAAPELALKAAALYYERLNQPLDAGRLWWQVVSAQPKSSSANIARDQLKGMQAWLDQQAQQWIKEADTQAPEQALITLERARAIAPALPGLPFAIARQSARGNDRARLQSAIQLLVQRNQAQPRDLANLPRMIEWLAQPAFAQFIEDLLGGSQRDALVAIVNQRQPEYEAKLARYHSDMANYEKILAGNQTALEEWSSCTSRCSRQYKSLFSGMTYKEYQKCDGNCSWTLDRQRVENPTKPTPPVKPE